MYTDFLLFSPRFFHSTFRDGIQQFRDRITQIILKKRDEVRNTFFLLSYIRYSLMHSSLLKYIISHL